MTDTGTREATEADVMVMARLTVEDYAGYEIERIPTPSGRQRVAFARALLAMAAERDRMREALEAVIEECAKIAEGANFDDRGRGIPSSDEARAVNEAARRIRGKPMPEPSE